MIDRRQTFAEPNSYLVDSELQRAARWEKMVAEMKRHDFTFTDDISAVSGAADTEKLDTMIGVLTKLVSQSGAIGAHAPIPSEMLLLNPTNPSPEAATRSAEFSAPAAPSKLTLSRF